MKLRSAFVLLLAMLAGTIAGNAESASPDAAAGAPVATNTQPQKITIGGIVVDDAGQPVAGATLEIVVEYKDDHAWHKVETDAQGVWTIQGLRPEPKTINVGVYHTQYASCDPEGFYPIEEYPPADLIAQKLKIILPRGVKINGTAKDTAGNPIPGATATYGRTLCSNELPSITADSAGKFSFGTPLNETAYILVQAKGYAPELMKIPVKESPVAADFTLKPAHLLRGKVVDPEGNPVPSANVYLDTWRNVRTLRVYLKTDKNGNFEWPDAPEDEILVDAGKTGYLHISRASIKAGNDNILTAEPATEIRGNIVDSETGKPITKYKTPSAGFFDSWEKSTNVEWDENRMCGNFYATENYPESEPGKYQFVFITKRKKAGIVFRVSAEGYETQISDIIKADGKLHKTVIKLSKKNPNSPQPVKPKNTREITALVRTGDNLKTEIQYRKIYPKNTNAVPGTDAPDITFKTFAGEEKKLSGYRGKYVLLDFWATWCGPCIGEIPKIQAALDEFKAREDLVVLSLSLDDIPEKPEAFVKKKNIQWAQGFLDGEWDSKAIADYNVNGIPSIWLISPEGKILEKGLRGEGIKDALKKHLPAQN